MNERVTDVALEERIVAFTRDASLAIVPHDEDLVPELAARLPAGTAVYVVHPSRSHVQDVVRVAVKLQTLGLQARPHLVARAIPSERQLRELLARLHGAGIEQVLVVAGDRNAPAGPFASTLELLRTGATADCGMKTVAVAGHPEGAGGIGPGLLWQALHAKQSFAEETGTRVEVVTQFGFDPHAVFEWQRQGGERGITLPVHVGLAGPTPLPRLIRAAMQCRIGPSLHTLARTSTAFTYPGRLAPTPEDMLVGLVRHHGMPAAIVKPHFYCFGGCLETARWLRSVIEGSFELTEDGSRFTVRA